MSAGGTRGRIKRPLEFGLGAKETAASIGKAARAKAVRLVTLLRSLASGSWLDEGPFAPSVTPSPKISRKTQRLRGRSRRGVEALVASSATAWLRLPMRGRQRKPMGLHSAQVTHGFPQVQVHFAAVAPLQ